MTAFSSFRDAGQASLTTKEPLIVVAPAFGDLVHH